MKKLLGKTYVSTPEIAEQLGYNFQTIRRWRNDETIPAKNWQRMFSFGRRLSGIFKGKTQPE